MIEAAILIFKEYGIIGLIASILGIFVFYEKKKTDRNEKRIKELEDKVEIMDDKVENFHDGCHVPADSIKTLFQEIEELKRTDMAIDGDMKEFKAEVKAELKNLKSGQKSMQRGIDSILDHLLNRKG